MIVGKNISVQPCHRFVVKARITDNSPAPQRSVVGTRVPLRAAVGDSSNPGGPVNHLGGTGNRKRSGSSHYHQAAACATDPMTHNREIYFSPPTGNLYNFFSEDGINGEIILPTNRLCCNNRRRRNGSLMLGVKEVALR